MASDQETKPTTLWCIRIPGPDDLYAQPDHAAAVTAAERHNAAVRQYLDKQYAKRTRDDLDPQDDALMAVVEPWPWSAKSHAEALIREAERECVGNVR